MTRVLKNMNYGGSILLGGLKNKAKDIVAFALFFNPPNKIDPP